MHDNTLKFIGELTIIFWNSFLLRKRIIVYIEFVRELPTRVNFFVLELVIVEAHPLKMNDEIIWCFLQEASLCHIALVLASIALILGDDLPLDVFFEGIVDIFETLYF